MGHWDREWDTGFGGGTRGWPWGLTVSPSPAYRTVCGVNGPLVVLDNVKVGDSASGDTGTACSVPCLLSLV
uniref:Uncharacterized protein n=1 Tax=Cyanoderma ruficeps TaxID=181631 RepID=A0A8C3QKZ7_9PASS